MAFGPLFPGVIIDDWDDEGFKSDKNEKQDEFVGLDDDELLVDEWIVERLWKRFQLGIPRDSSGSPNSLYQELSTLVSGMKRLTN